MAALIYVGNCGVLSLRSFMACNCVTEWPACGVRPQRRWCRCHVLLTQGHGTARLEGTRSSCGVGHMLCQSVLTVHCCLASLTRYLGYGSFVVYCAHKSILEVTVFTNILCCLVWRGGCDMVLSPWGGRADCYPEGTTPPK